MGRDVMSVVDGELRVYGVDGLRVADASIMPRVTSGKTMTPCVVIGEMAAAILRREMIFDWHERQALGTRSNGEIGTGVLSSRSTYCWGNDSHPPPSALYKAIRSVVTAVWLSANRSSFP